MLSPDTIGQHGCNCDDGIDSCPLGGRCKTPSLVYRAEVNVDGSQPKFYYGQTNVTFKTRWNNHNSDMNYREKSKRCQLIKHVWRLRDKKKDPTFIPDISWSIVKEAKPYQRGGRRCDLCLTEKSMILTNLGPNTLNKRNELFTRCRHKDKHKLQCFAGRRPLEDNNRERRPQTQNEDQRTQTEAGFGGARPKRRNTDVDYRRFF